MKICLACYEDRLASVYENASEFLMYELRDNNVYPAGHLSLPSKDPTDRTSALVACGVSLLVCGAVCGCTRSSLENAGIRLEPWIKGDVDVVLKAIRTNSLSELSMPGCGNRFGTRNGRMMGQGRGGGQGCGASQEPGMSKGRGMGQGQGRGQGRCRISDGTNSGLKQGKCRNISSHLNKTNRRES